MFQGWRFPLMEQNGTRLENKSPREIMNIDHKLSSKDCSEVLGKNGNIFSREGLVYRVARDDNVFAIIESHCIFYLSSLLGVQKSLGHTQIGHL